ncbi:MAG TPA: phosphodiester glycosidase family protein [Gaiella sp.]|nr:phosphodiester glycosidase family protein [Gaiella sp.]
MRRLVSLAAVSSLAALLLASAGGAAPRELWPGVTYESGVQFTTHGPVAINVLRGPRPGGLTTLEPVLSNDTVVGREKLTTMEVRLRRTATVAGVNGDYFTLATGKPSGVLVRDAQLVAPPNSGRASAGIRSDGLLDIRRVAFKGTWRTTVGPRPLGSLNATPGANGAGLYTNAYGASTPALPGSAAVILFPFPAATPEVDLAAPIVEATTDGGAVAIPAGGAVLVARGTAAQALRTEALAGGTITVTLGISPSWPDLVGAIGGGPQIVRNGVPIFRAGEVFSTKQLGPRAPRSAVGQLRDGRILLVAVDGRQPGYSVGLTNRELAQALVRLGAVTGMALDSGGSTTMAFDGELLNRPSDGAERRISTALAFLYRGVFAPEPPAHVSPNGDGVDDSPNLGYRLVRPSSVTVTLRAPDGSAPVSTTAQQAPGTYPVAFPGASEAGSASAGAVVAAGPWTFEVKAVDDTGQSSAMTRGFVVDDTLGFLGVPKLRAVPPGGREIPITFRLARAARVSVTVVDAAGRVVRKGLAVPAAREAGEQRVIWDGLGTNARRLAGRFTVQVAATSSLGRSQLHAPITLRKAAG